MTATGYPPTAVVHPVRLPRRGTAALVVAGAAIALKLPQAVIGLVRPEGIEGLTPAVSSSTGVIITLAWVLFSLALLAMRKWLGAVSAGWFCIVSLLSGVRLLSAGFEIWGGWQVLTAAVAVVAIIVAIVRGAFAGSRW